MMHRSIAIAGIWLPVAVFAVSGDKTAAFCMAILSLSATWMVMLP